MTKSAEIRESINAKNAELVNLNETEGKNLTEETRDAFQTKFDNLEKEIEGLKADEKRELKIEQIRIDAATEEKRKLDLANAAGGSKTTNTPEKEMRDNFNVIDFVNQVKSGRLEGRNAELHQEAVKEARENNVTVEHFGIPSLVLGEVRDMNAGTDTAGGYAIAEDKRGIITYLTDAMVTRGLGADYMTGLVGDLSFPREDNNIDATWKAENATADELSPTLDEVTLSPKRLTAYVDLSNQLLRQTSPSIQSRVEARLGNALGRGIDKAAIQGTGASNQPTGILNTSGIGDVAMGTNGAALTWAKVVELLREVDVDNALIGQLGYLTNPLVHAAMQTIEKASGTAQFILNEATGSVNGYSSAYSNHVPSNLTKGSGTDLSAMLFGNWNDLMIGQWGGLDVMVNPYTKAKEGMTELIAAAYVDVAVARPKSFAAIKDIVTT